MSRVYCQEWPGGVEHLLLTGKGAAIWETALQSADLGAIEGAESLIHYLGGRGYLEFGDLLRSGSR
ncbi:MAG: hypothetical protein HPY52_16325 [Firmicutes bacterium]|nr:hypothetical protein [Bacillota bacterium]